MEAQPPEGWRGRASLGFFYILAENNPSVTTEFMKLKSSLACARLRQVMWHEMGQHRSKT